MKRFLLSAFALVATGVFAQLPNGSIAPDFTATDINGNTHTLSTYLNSGKHVLLNISATWCGPCWNYHNSHSLADFYEAYGPDGSDEIMILYVEGDSTTPVDAIYGVGSDTWGDWTAGTPYPIIDSGTIANQYQIAYFPTLYRICSSGTTQVLQPLNSNGSINLTPTNLKNNINTGCGTLLGAANHAKLSVSNDIYSCGSSTSTSLSTSLKNYGNSNITSAVLVIKENGNVVATHNYSGNITQFSTATIALPSVTFNTTSDYEVEVQSVNGGTIYNADFGVASINVLSSETVNSTDLEVRVYTDNYPSEISWKIKNSSGTVVAEGGPYQPGTADQWGGGGPDANTTKIHNISVSADECYSIELLDAYNDGWIYNSSAAPVSGLEIFENGDSVVFVDGNFQFSTFIRNAAFKHGETASTGNIHMTQFSVFPNPSTGIFNISTTEPVNVNIVDVTGKTVYKADALDNNAIINLSSLQSGIYLMQVSGESINKTEKLIIK